MTLFLSSASSTILSCNLGVFSMLLSSNDHGILNDYFGGFEPFYTCFLFRDFKLILNFLIQWSSSLLVITAASSTGRPQKDDHITKTKHHTVEGTWRQRPIRDNEEDYNNAGNSDRNTVSPPVSASYYPYAMDRLDDAMIEIPFDEFHDLWKFVDDDPGDHHQEEGNEVVDDEVSKTPSSVITTKKHPRDMTLPSPGTGIGINGNNKNRRKNLQRQRQEEQLIQNPRTGGTLKRVKTPSNLHSSQNPLLAQVLGISIESVYIHSLSYPFEISHLPVMLFCFSSWIPREEVFSLSFWTGSEVLNLVFSYECPFVYECSLDLDFLICFPFSL